MTDTERAAEQRLDWGLAEVVGDERPPDLTATIVARHRTRAYAGGRTGRTHRWPGWASAATVLLGIALVVAVWIAPRDDVPASDHEYLKPEVVYDVAAIEALPPDTRAVRMHQATDAMLEAAVRLRDLEQLEVQYTWRLVHGMMMRVAPPENPASITDDGLRHVAKLAKLRYLDLAGPLHVRGPGLAHLARLPVLEVLHLRYVDTPDEHLDVLPELGALHTLDLSFNHGFEARGIDAVLRCRGLRELSVRGCQQLHGSTIARLAELPRLESLDAGSIDRINWAWGGVRDEESDRVLRAAGKLAERPGTGVTDEALRGLIVSPRLRVLNIASGRFTAAGIAALGELHTLEVLDLFGAQLPDDFVLDLPEGLRELRVCDEHTDAFCRHVREHLVSLRKLDIGACDKITDAGARALLQAPWITELSLRQCYGLTRASLPLLLEARHLRSLDLRHVEWVTPADAAELRAALPSTEIRSNHDAR